jgi:hypothetical protein
LKINILYSEKSFMEILTILQSKPTIVKKLHKVMEEDLFNALQSDLELLVTEECLVEGMKKLNYLIDETTVPANVQLWLV